MKLLAGGFESPGLTDRWRGPDLKLMREEAAALRAELLKPKLRRAAEKKQAPAQGSLA